MHLSSRCYRIVCHFIFIIAAVAMTTNENLDAVAMTRITTTKPANRNAYYYPQLLMSQSYRLGRRSLQTYTETTFPTPGNRQCMSDAKLWYVCDPYSWLDHTYALNLNKSLNPVKFSRCLPRKNDKLYSLGLAIAGDIRSADSATCGQSQSSSSSSSSLSDYDDEPSSFMKFNLARIARRLRNRWMYNFPYSCGSDILLLFVRNLTLCHRDRLVTYSSGRWMLAVSFSGKIRNSLSEESALGLEKGEFAVSYDYHTVDTSASSLYYSILRIFSILDSALPSPDELFRRDLSASPDNQNGNNLHAPFPKHTVPAWALIAFVVALCLTMVCTFIGHWVNTSGSRKKFYNPDRFPFARNHHDSRRWRAGFAGGMMELHNNSSGQPQHGGRSYSQVGLKPVARTKSKMFGAMSMSGAGKRSNFNPQYNYQRV